MADEIKDLGFDKWWYEFGSGMPPLPGEEAETHVHRVCKAYETDLVEAFNRALNKPRKDGDAAPVVDESSSPEEGQG